VRELRNLLERTVLLCDGDEIEAQHVLDAVSAGRPASNAVVRGVEAQVRAVQASPAVDLRSAERAALRDIVARHRGSRAELAAQLGISERSLYRKLKNLDDETP
jgi:DNA-binding NtrC family response regulator